MQISTSSVIEKKKREREKNVELHTRIKYLHEDESNKRIFSFSFPEIKLHFEIVFVMKYDFSMRLFPYH